MKHLLLTRNEARRLCGVMTIRVKGGAILRLNYKVIVDVNHEEVIISIQRYTGFSKCNVLQDSYYS